MTDMTPNKDTSCSPTFSRLAQNESRTTKKILDAVPVDKANYQPDACAKPPTNFFATSRSPTICSSSPSSTASLTPAQ